MKTTRRAVSLLLVAGFILGVAPSALWADSGVSTFSGFLQLDPNASGTKLSGPLTVYFQDLGSDASCALFRRVNMFFAMRLTKGNDDSGFAGQQLGICIGDRDTQITTIRGFITTVVIPTLFSCSPNFNCPPYALKNITDLVQDNQVQAPPPFFWVVDLELAVRQ